MVDLEDVGIVIAERELDSADGRTVQVLIGQPQPFPEEGGDYYCPFQITGIGNDMVMHLAGVDSVQALLLALKMIGARLYTSDEGRAGTLTWLEHRNLGFPVVPYLQDLVPTDGE